MIRVALLPLIVLISLWVASAGAQVSCGNRAYMVERLVSQYREMQMGLGLRIDGSRLIEVWVNCITGTWTILKTYTDGIACVMAVGEDWHGVGCDRRNGWERGT